MMPKAAIAASNKVELITRKTREAPVWQGLHRQTIKLKTAKNHR